MKTIVIYKSKYGAAKQYAEWIAEDLGCDIRDLGEIRKADLEPYENIIFGGGVHAGGIEGFDTFKKWVKPILSDAYFAAHDKQAEFHIEDYHPEKKIAIFAVGVNVQIFDTRAQLRDVNFDKRWLRPLTCYFFDGRYNPELVKGIDLMIMNAAMKMLRNKGLNMNKDERVLLERVEKGCDLMNRDEIAPLVNEFKSL